MKIYFAGAIRGGRDDAVIYNELISFLQSLGTVLTEHVGDMGLTEQGDDGPDDRFIHDRDMAWLKNCDMVVAEVTRPSLGVGYEIGWACAMNKPVLALYRPQTGKTLSAMIAGCSGIMTAQYFDIDRAREIIRRFVAGIASRRHRDSD